MQQQPGQQQNQISDEDAELARVLEMSKNMKWASEDKLINWQILAQSASPFMTVCYHHIQLWSL